MITITLVVDGKRERRAMFSVPRIGERVAVHVNDDQMRFLLVDEVQYGDFAYDEGRRIVGLDYSVVLVVLRSPL